MTSFAIEWDTTRRESLFSGGKSTRGEIHFIEGTLIEGAGLPVTSST